MTGKKNKYDEKHKSKHAKFPMRTMEITEDFLRYNTTFYADYDFLHMLFHLVMGMFVFAITTRIVYPELMNTNLTLYLAIVTILLYCANLTKNTFVSGYCRLTDETKVQILISMKSFIIVFGVLAYTEG